MKPSLRLRVLIAILLATLSSNSRAGTVTWVGGGNATTSPWDLSSTWSSGSLPGTGDDVVIGGATLNNGATILGANGNITLSATNGSTFSPSVKSLTFDNSLNQFSTAGSLRLQNSISPTTGGNSIITLNTAGVDAIKVLSGNVEIFSRSSSASLAVNLGYSGLSNFNVATGSTLRISPASQGGNLTGTGGVNKTGGGTLEFGNNQGNSFTGGLTISQGTVNFNLWNTLGSEVSLNPTALVINGGTLVNIRNGSGPVTSAANRGISVGNATGTISTSNASITLVVNGVITDVAGQTGNLAKTGPGGLRLSAANTYTGTTTVSTGTLFVTNTTGSGTGSGPVSVASGATLGGNGTIAGNVALDSATIGTANNILSLSSNLTTTGTSNVAALSTVNVAGTTTVSTGTFTVNGTLGGSGAITVASGATLAGNATLNTATTLAAGGTLGTTGNTLTLGSTFAVTGTNSIVSGATINVTGNTTISGGTFSVNGTLGGSGAKFVTSGATLGGNGTILGTTTISDSATLSPGNSPGLLSFTGDLTFNHVDAKAVFEINGTGRGSTYDAVNISGALTYNGDLTVNFGYSPDVPPDAVYNLFDFATESGNFDSISISGTYAASLLRAGDLWSGTDAGNTVTFSFDQTSGDLTVSAIPEPSAFAIVAGFSTLGFAALRRRRARRAH